MEIEVNIWMPNAYDVGHASLAVKDHTYISWWPTEDPLKARPGAAPSFSGDVSAEGRLPDLVVRLHDLQADKICEWWDNFIAAKNTYSLSNQNCSWAVVTALKAGGSDSFFQWHRLLEVKNLKKPVRNVLSPTSSIIRFAWNLSEKVLSGAETRRAFKRSVVDVANDFSPTWSPEDVLTYCLALQQSIFLSNLSSN